MNDNPIQYTPEGQPYRWCTFHNREGYTCGMVVYETDDLVGARCGRHKGKEEPKRVYKGKKFSGDSSYRVKMGQFQAKPGR